MKTVGTILTCIILSVTLIYGGLHISNRVDTAIAASRISYNDLSAIPDDVLQDIPGHLSETTLQIPILMYHYVEYVTDKNDTFRESMNIKPDTFELQMKTLKDAGYTFMHARELGEVLKYKRILPKDPILITIDDGHWDVATDILPILQKYDIKATVYVIPGFTGGSDFMTDKQIQYVISSGLIEIGSHTIHHIPLQGQPPEITEYEITESKKMLENQYHIPIVSFTYPSGSFDTQAIDFVEKAGYTTAMSTIEGTQVNRANRYFLYRLRPGYRVGADLIRHISQNY